jgi:hypothetical protein
MMRRFALFVAVFAAAVLFSAVGRADTSVWPQPGTASVICPYCYCGVDTSVQHRGTRRDINKYIAGYKQGKNYKGFFRKLREEYLLGEFIEDVVTPEMQKKTQQVVSSDQNTMNAEASIRDAEEANEDAQDTAGEQADTIEEHAPNPVVGVLAGLSRGLAESTVRLRQSKIATGGIQTDRMLGLGDAKSKGGAGTLEEWRVRQMLETYVDEDQLGGRLKGIAEGDDENRLNRDIDIGRSLLNRSTYDFNFDDDDLTEDEEDFLAIKENLIPSTTMSSQTMENLASPDAQYRDIPELLSAAARKSLTERTINVIAGQKAQGSDVSADQIRAIMTQLGYAEDDQVVEDLTGKASYDGHMQILTRYMFQDPNNYAALVAAPESIRRVMVSQNAIRNMQQFDTYTTLERTENLTALWAWLETRGMQQAAQNALSNRQQ